MAWSIGRTTMTGAQIAQVIPVDVSSVRVQANGGDISIQLTATGDIFTLFEGSSIIIEDPNLAQTTVYLTGAAGVIAECLYGTGTFS